VKRPVDSAPDKPPLLARLAREGSTFPTPHGATRRRSQ